ncbi:MAG: hypothetical protein ACI4C3_00335 [Bacteroides sp.]
MKQKLLRYQYVRMLCEQKDEEGNRVPFNVRYLCKDGTVTWLNNVVTIAVNARRRRRKVKQLDSGEIRELHDVLILQVNDTKIVVN